MSSESFYSRAYRTNSPAMTTIFDNYYPRVDEFSNICTRLHYKPKPKSTKNLRMFILYLYTRDTKKFRTHNIIQLVNIMGWRGVRRLWVLLQYCDPQCATNLADSSFRHIQIHQSLRIFGHLAPLPSVPKIWFKSMDQKQMDILTAYDQKYCLYGVCPTFAQVADFLKPFDGPVLLRAIPIWKQWVHKITYALIGELAIGLVPMEELSKMHENVDFITSVALCTRKIPATWELVAQVAKHSFEYSRFTLLAYDLLNRGSLPTQEQITEIKKSRTECRCVVNRSAIDEFLNQRFT